MLATYEPVGWHAIDYHSAFRSLPPPMPGHLLCSIGPLSTATASSSADVGTYPYHFRKVAADQSLLFLQRLPTRQSEGYYLEYIMVCCIRPGTLRLNTNG